ncbi:MAG: hypothetical protein HYV26_06475, partial [Candidatus Hydrogenedentes bacterium]|nr:hypothetical protein [Candidatus Hydrogenedentota bacterium]
MSRPAVLQFALRLCRKILLPLFIIGVAGVLVGAVAFHDALYNRFVHFPRLARAWAALGAQREAVTLDDGWTEFRGICHSHSELSHDSEVPFPEVLAAAKEARLEFLLMSDHCTDGVADFSLQWRGLHDGILF